jgi:hypothetical protein
MSGSKNQSLRNQGISKHIPERKLKTSSSHVSLSDCRTVSRARLSICIIILP